MKHVAVSIALVLVLCGLLSAQEAASNATAPPPAPTVTGSGAASYIPLWTGTTTVGKSRLYQTGGDVGIGTTSPKWALDVSGRVNVSLGYLIGGTTVLSLAGKSADANLSVGDGAFPHNTSGTLDTAIGAFALNGNYIGQFETATGAYALYSDDGDNNTATGAYAMYANTTGQTNTAIGNFALNKNSDGNGNIAVGYQAADSVSSHNSNNIHIGSAGVFADSGVVRIGTTGTQLSFFAAGVRGVATGLADAVPVVIDGNGQLGTVSSSRRFKEDIQDMGDASRGLMRLRPVTFRYQKAFNDGSKPVQYGLIAEEVAEVYPDLVAHSTDGQIETVKYQVLDSMLLNEVQRQQAEIQALEARLAKMEAALERASRANTK